MTARMKSRQRQQLRAESVTDFVAALQRMVAKCKFVAYGSSYAVKEQLIVGVAAEHADAAVVAG